MVKTKINEYFGEVGNNYKDVLTVVMIRQCKGKYGPYDIVTLYNSSGHKFIYINNKRNLKENVTVKASFTVKQHNTFKNSKYTIINYVKLKGVTCLK